VIDQRIVVENAADFGRVAVMYGGNSCEREVSLNSGAAVLAALQSRGIDAVGWDPAENDLTKFAAADFARVWIALHGPGGEDGALQGMLQWLNVPYTGSDILASSVAMDKVLTKEIAAELARETGLPRREVYARVLALRASDS
jgi:D-alanine-D-alanine ligase